MPKRKFNDNDGIPPWVTASGQSIPGRQVSFTPPAVEPNVELGSVPPSIAIEIYRAMELAWLVERNRYRTSAEPRKSWDDQMALQRFRQSIFEKLPTEMQDELVREDEEREAREREEY